MVLVSVAAFSAALHVGGGILLPQDLCPEHVGSVFGVMNTGGAVAGDLAPGGVQWQGGACGVFFF